MGSFFLRGEIEEALAFFLAFDRNLRLSFLRARMTWGEGRGVRAGEGGLLPKAFMVFGRVVRRNSRKVGHSLALGGDDGDDLSVKS